MKADLIYHSALFSSTYGRDKEAIVAKNGKSVTIHGYKQRLKTYVWGLWSEELAAEARAINKLSDELQARHQALDARLRATQPAALAAAKAAPVDVKSKPFRFEGELKL